MKWPIEGQLIFSSIIDGETPDRGDVSGVLYRGLHEMCFPGNLAYLSGRPIYMYK